MSAVINFCCQPSPIVGGIFAESAPVLLAAPDFSMDPESGMWRIGFISPFAGVWFDEYQVWQCVDSIWYLFGQGYTWDGYTSILLAPIDTPFKFAGYFEGNQITEFSGEFTPWPAP